MIISPGMFPLLYFLVIYNYIIIIYFVCLFSFLFLLFSSEELWSLWILWCSEREGKSLSKFQGSMKQLFSMSHSITLNKTYWQIRNVTSIYIYPQIEKTTLIDPVSNLFELLTDASFETLTSLISCAIQNESQNAKPWNAVAKPD